MGAVTRPRGRLPRRVYWFRRLLVLGVAAVLVIAIASLLRPSGGPGGDQAAPVAAAPTNMDAAPTTSSASPATQGDRDRSRKDRHRKKTLPEPEGPCEDSDVVVTPSVPDAHVNEPIKIVLELTTQESRACTWTVDPDSVFVTISADDGPLWSSQQCPSAIPTRDVVPRRKKADKVRFFWRGQESDPGCTRSTEWVLPGQYTISAVARGAVEPVEVPFSLGQALRPPPKRTESPADDPTGNHRKQRSSEPSPTPAPSGSPRGQR